MVTGNVVPFDSIAVDIVEHTHARLHATVDVKLGVVGLGDVLSLELCLVSGVRPGLVAPAWRSRVGGRHLNSGSRPEPTVNPDGLKILTVTSLEVAQPP